ncbi:unnamed protein product [Brugia timori]|uniref:Secreted protein n=1 Tax=Brugia timori TaxID=42155 RepID=A0A0R3Q5K9_9BILA|nr:unnamed protein product [Brugia timori]
MRTISVIMLVLFLSLLFSITSQNQFSYLYDREKGSWKLTSSILLSR